LPSFAGHAMHVVWISISKRCFQFTIENRINHCIPPARRCVWSGRDYMDVLKAKDRKLKGRKGSSLILPITKLLLICSIRLMLVICVLNWIHIHLLPAETDLLPSVLHSSHSVWSL